MKLGTACMLAALALAMSSCATSVPLASESDDAGAKTFAPPNGRASIYVVRDGGYVSGMFVVFRVSLDGIERGALANTTYLVFSVDSGRHIVTASGNENREQVTLDIEAGQNYFVSVRSKIGYRTARVTVKQLTATEGRQAVRDARLASGL